MLRFWTMKGGKPLDPLPADYTEMAKRATPNPDVAMGGCVLSLEAKGGDRDDRRDPPEKIP